MKKLTIIALLLSLTINAQWIKKNTEEYSTLGVSSSIYSINSSYNPNISIELTLISHFGYVKGNIQFIPSLLGGYIDYTGGVGLNQLSSITLNFLALDINTRIYEGIHGGLIKRGTNTYPTFGVELGEDFKLTDNISIGGKLTNNFRDDLLYIGNSPKWIQSLSLTTTFKL